MKCQVYNQVSNFKKSTKRKKGHEALKIHPFKQSTGTVEQLEITDIKIM